MDHKISAPFQAVTPRFLVPQDNSPAGGTQERIPVGHVTVEQWVFEGNERVLSPGRDE